MASVLRRDIRTVYGYLEQGLFPNARKPKGGWLIPEDDVKAFLDRPPQSTPHRLKAIASPYLRR